MPSPEAIPIAATGAYQEGLRRLKTALSAALVANWFDLGSYDREDLPRWEAIIAPASEAFAGQSAALALGYVATVADTIPPAFEMPTVLADPEAPFLRHWRGLNDGKPWQQSIEEAAGAVEEYASDVVHSTARLASDTVTDNVVGWRRVLVGASCEWCALVSTQRYHSAETADFGHARCDCTVVPITANSDPGQIINSDLLAELKARNVSNRTTANRQARRALDSAESATARRDAALARLDGETDPTRRARIEAQARRAEREASAFRAKAAEAQSRSVKSRLPNETGYVDPSGSPVPRTDPG